MQEAALRELLASPLKVRARVLARALWSGAEATRRRGTGETFRELREYRAGDPIRRIDWRASARTDRWLVREFERAAHLRFVLAIDGSRSMAYPEGDPFAKNRIAATLAAAVGLHALRQGHAVSLWSDRWWSEPRSGRAAEAPLLAAIEKGAGITPWPFEIEPLARMADVAIVIGDWFDPEAPDRLRDLGLAVARGVEVRALAVHHGDELDFPFRDAVEFDALEATQAPRRRRLRPREVGERYRASLASHFEACRQAAFESSLPLRWHRHDDALFATASFLATGVSR